MLCEDVVCVSQGSGECECSLGPEGGCCHVWWAGQGRDGHARACGGREQEALGLGQRIEVGTAPDEMQSEPWRAGGAVSRVLVGPAGSFRGVSGGGEAALAGVLESWHSCCGGTGQQGPGQKLGDWLC